MIDLEVPKKFRPLVEQARGMAEEVFWPISRKYDRAEHEYPAELDLVSAVIDGLSDSGAGQGAGASGSTRSAAEPAGGDAGQKEAEVGAVGSGRNKKKGSKENRNGANLSSALSIMETCRGDVGLTLSIPRQGLGNAAIAAVANDEQKARYAGKWAAMAITEPSFGSDSAAVTATAQPKYQAGYEPLLDDLLQRRTYILRLVLELFMEQTRPIRWRYHRYT